MPESAAILLLPPPDDAIPRALEKAGRALGAAVRVAHGFETADRWDLLCLDEEAPAATAATIAAARQQDPDAVVLWLTRSPHGSAAQAALAAGVDDLLEVPLQPAAARARLRGHLERVALRRQARHRSDLEESSQAQLAAYASQLEASHENLRELYLELEAQALDLQHLLSAQEQLILLQVPEKIRASAEQALGQLFPGAERRAAAYRRGSPPSPEVRRTVVRNEGGPGWTSATLPLVLGREVLGFLEVRARPGQHFGDRQLDLLEVFAAQTSQALHRARLYESLSEGKAEWERTFDTIADSISVVGPDFRLRRVNRALAALRGLEPRELVGSLCYRVLRDRHEVCPNCPVAKALETGEVVHREGEPIGKTHAFDYHAYPLRDDEGRVFAAIAYARDVSREEQLTQGLRRSEKLMTLGQIAAGVAHEINNPLTAVSSYAQLLEMQLDDPKLAESARRIQQGIDRIHHLVRNLMSFVRPRDEDVYPVGINEIVTDTLSFSRYEVTRGDTRLVEMLGDDLPKVLGAKQQLEQLLVNLLTNARDAVAGKGHIQVSTRAEGDRVVLEVADNGVGVAARDLDKLFEPFYTTKPVGKGTGLGLFVAAGIAKKHGGELSVASAPGQGTTVSLSLPAFSP